MQSLLRIQDMFKIKKSSYFWEDWYKLVKKPLALDLWPISEVSCRMVSPSILMMTDLTLFNDLLRYCDGPSNNDVVNVFA